MGLGVYNHCIVSAGLKLVQMGNVDDRKGVFDCRMHIPSYQTVKDADLECFSWPITFFKCELIIADEKDS